MYRLFYFLAVICLPAIVSWWLFIPMAILFVYLAKLPYELILAGAILDSFFYFGEGFLMRNLLTAASIAVIGVALFLNGRIHWQKRI